MRFDFPTMLRIATRGARCHLLAAPVLLLAACAANHVRMDGQNAMAAADTPALSAPPTPSSIPAAEDEGYLLQVGDRLALRFFHVPQLNDTVRVRPDGRLSLQLIGEIQAAGLSVNALERDLETRYASHLKRPEVSIDVQEYSPPRIYVGGEVARPGTQELRGKVTTLQSIMSAGGFTPDAETQNVVVLRYTGGLAVFSQFNLEPPFSESLKNDVVLQPFDVVYVPKTRIASVADFFSRYVNNIVPLYRNLGLSVLYNLNRTLLEVRP